MFDTNELEINMGPQHPSTHGVLRVVMRLDGEKVVDCDVVIGYLHRGIEKLSENRNWTQIILLTDRMDYIAAATSNVGYCETVEKLLQLEVPRRARYVRTIDANDMLYAFDASRDYDPSPHLGEIRAPLFAVNSADDEVNPPELGILDREIRRVPHGRYILIPTSDATRGHGTHSLPAVWGAYLAELLAATEPGGR